MTEKLTAGLPAEFTGRRPNRSADGTPVVELRSVTRTYPGDPPVYALRDVDLTISAGDYVSIVGASGSGKSTLLHLVGLLDRPTSGSYLLGGQDVAGFSERRRSGLRGAWIGFVFQAFHLIPRRTVLDNVGLALLYQGVPRSQRRRRAQEALERVGLAGRANFLPTQLSGGERQRVAVARALTGRPSLLLADEPTGNLDRENAAGIMELFGELHDDGLTLAVITHDEAVSRLAQRQIRIADGQVW